MLFRKNNKANSKNKPGNVLELEVTGMTCPSCATHVTEALQKVDGVVEAKVPNWQNKRALVTVEGDVQENDCESQQIRPV